MVPALLMANAVNAAEIYNNNGNKLTFTGKSPACTISQTTLQRTAIRPMHALASKAKRRSLPS